MDLLVVLSSLLEQDVSSKSVRNLQIAEQDFFRNLQHFVQKFHNFSQCTRLQRQIPPPVQEYDGITTFKTVNCMKNVVQERKTLVREGGDDMQQTLEKKFQNEKISFHFSLLI